MWRGCTVILSLVATIRGEMEGYIVGGSYATIQQFPHSAFLSVSCRTNSDDKDETSQWICGASVINQRILLTAGHCISECIEATEIIINLGDVNNEKGVVKSSNDYILHEEYNTVTNVCDVALIRSLQEIEFNSTIRRVALLKEPPYYEPAYTAGWGLINELTGENAVMLKQIDQHVRDHDNCTKTFKKMLKGTICASARMADDYVANGDSGSALMVRGFIQIGLVSYKVPNVAPNVIIYTDVGYYYDWIQENAEQLHCGGIPNSLELN